MCLIPNAWLLDQFKFGHPYRLFRPDIPLALSRAQITSNFNFKKIAEERIPESVKSAQKVLKPLIRKPSAAVTRDITAITGPG